MAGGEEIMLVAGNDRHMSDPVGNAVASAVANPMANAVASAVANRRMR
jgi:hypothetical protein